jgi:hypothetical protein
MYTYIRSEPELWTVGSTCPDGKWDPESDHGSPEEAAQRVAWLNGGAPPPPDNGPSHVTLVAALRTEFNLPSLEALWIQLRDQEHNATSLGTLVQAVRDARDPLYDAGDVHPAVKAFLDKARGRGAEE